MLGVEEGFLKRIFVFLLGFLLLYALFELRGVFGFMQVKIEYPKEATVYENPVPIYGTTQNVEELYINDMLISTQKDGTFKDVLYLGNGYNEVVIRAVNKYGKVKEKTMLYTYSPAENLGTE